MELSLQNEEVWLALKSRLEKVGCGISGYMYPIVEIPKGEQEIAYTSPDKIIHLTRSHSMLKEMNDEEQCMFVTGLFGHELMHQLDTDFEEFAKVQESLWSYEQFIFLKIFNCIEDPAIEYWSPHYFGGYLLDALHFMIKRCYKDMPDIDRKQDSFTQLLSAFIQYGNGGLLKGELTGEAQTYFYQLLPLLDRTIEEPAGAKRIAYAKQIFDKTRPLWVNQAKSMEAMQRLMEELRQLFEASGITGVNPQSGGKPLGDSEKEAPNNSTNAQKKKRRNITFRRVSEEEAKELAGAKGESGKLPDGDIEVLLVEGKGDLSTEGPSINAPSAEEDGEPEKSPKEPALIDESEYGLSEKDIAMLQEEIQIGLEEVRKEAEKKKKADAMPLNDMSGLSACYPKVRCLNKRASGGKAMDAYQKTVAPMNAGINSLTSQLKRIFRNDADELEHKTSGKINISRLAGGRMTPRVFDRRREPAQKSDMAILLAVDASGSMQGKNIQIAREAAIGLAEVFARLHVPLSIMTFTADCEGHDVVHTHYLMWHNTPAERIKLLNIRAESNNFDGYSIRYAGKYIARRPEQHKLIIVISDGRPACCYYFSATGLADTKNAIREAQKHANVIGVAIDADAEILHTMYGDKFIHIRKLPELFNQLGEKIKKEIESW